MTQTSLSRRQLLHTGGLGGLGLTLGGLWHLQAARAESATAVEPGIRACILIFYYGGPSHLDTLDMKLNAPREIRGEFNPISSAVPGLSVSEHLPLTARIMDKVAVIRSMHHSNRLHDSASIESLTGRQASQGDREEFAPIPQFFPCYGAALSYLGRERDLAVPHAALPWNFHNVIDPPCQGGGFLGAAYDPLRINGDPDRLKYSARMFSRPPGLPLERVTERRALLGHMDKQSRLAAQAETQPLRTLYNRAFDLMHSAEFARALEITQEPKKTRNRYGMYEPVKQGSGNGAEKAYGRNLRGQNLLLARRLVEAGVPFINIYDFKQQGQNWDSHSDNFNQHKKYLLPQADRAYSALIEDLDERGLLDSTLVVGMGEFGRTPKINRNAGRDHWPDCYSVTLAGGGVRGGFVYGASDRQGAYPVLDPVTPADLAATIYWRFGFDPAVEIPDKTGRPYRLAEGQPVKELFDW